MKLKQGNIIYCWHQNPWNLSQSIFYIEIFIHNKNNRRKVITLFTNNKYNKTCNSRYFIEQLHSYNCKVL